MLAISTSMIETCQTQGFNIVKRLGQGSYGAVFLCKRREHSKVKRLKVALKVTDTKIADPHFVEKFLRREIEILLKIRHPFIIYVYSIAQRRHKYYVYMRYAELGDLLEYLTKVGRVQETRARIWCGQLACAVEYLHHHNIAHRDIKCENILITSHHNTKLSDFGFATQYTRKKGEAMMLTTYCGTRQYACPEILTSKPYHPEKADMWALGVVLFILVYGQTPFKGSSPRKVAESQLGPLDFKKGITVSTQLLAIFPKIFDINEKNRFTACEFLRSEWIKMDARFKKDAINIERPQHSKLLLDSDEARIKFLESADRNDLLCGDKEVTYSPPADGSFISRGIQVPSISELINASGQQHVVYNVKIDTNDFIAKDKQPEKKAITNK